MKNEKISSLQGLPNWLQNPIQINQQISDVTLENEINNFNLSNHSIEKLKSLDISHLFPVQKAVIPHIKNYKNDLCVSAQTGSGKTLVYLFKLRLMFYHW